MGKVPAMQARNPEFRSLVLTEARWGSAIQEPSAEDGAETDRPQGTQAGQPRQMAKVQVQWETGFPKLTCTVTTESQPEIEFWPYTHTHIYTHQKT